MGGIAHATVESYGAYVLTGGTSGCLDAINGSLLSDGDVCTVRISTGTYFYVLDSTSAATESSPDIISPDTNAGDKRWLLTEVKPAASTTVEGTIEISTNTEAIAGTATDKALVPDNLAYVLQAGTMTYVADAQASDTYVATYVPAVAAYVTGMVVHFYAKTANTGACTLNVNALGAIDIKKLHDQDPATGDIEAGQILTVVYDGTNFQMQSQIAATIITATEVVQAATDTLTAAECSGTFINNYGQGAANTQTLPAAAEGLNGIVHIATAGAGAFHLKANTGDKIYLNGTALTDGDKASIATPAVGNSMTFWAFQTGAGAYDWMVSSGVGTTVTDGGA